MRLLKTLQEYKRIIKIARKPTKEEFERTLKITGLGVLLIGLVGFIIQVIFQVML